MPEVADAHHHLQAVLGFLPAAFLQEESCVQHQTIQPADSRLQLRCRCPDLCLIRQIQLKHLEPAAAPLA
eukprot:CAMPEP_0175510060 /NCGR_PEP_ID=MMETSP0096-20121207/11197_1 /TAXON_ID=311494 /ORGANISM="Alexandrium monilatum, Strain CCMP3105" /LENGTH=69 /DNA_ID=CAMNT_0016812231 /DNA_START=106 /DNA_END=312 /DNA_ORIENTATION=-